MKRFLATLVCAASLGSAFAQNTVQAQYAIGPFMTTHSLSLEDAAAVMAISRMTGLTPEVVLTTRGEVTTPWFDIAPAFMLSTQSGKPFSDIMTMYNAGQTWMDIANSLNVPSVYWNPLGLSTSGWTNTDFSNGVWNSMIRSNLALSQPDALYLESLNVPLNERLVAIELSRENNVPLRDVAATYSVNGHNWTIVQERYVQVQRPVVETTQVTQTVTETRSAPQPFVRTIVKEVPVVRTVVQKVPVYHTVYRSARPMRLAATKRHTTRRHSSKKRCICTCPEHKRMAAELARLKARRK